MVTVQSLGLYEPSALHYLVSEGYLDTNPEPSSYEWSIDLLRTNHGQEINEEILRVPKCVVWSRNGVIQRVFDLDIENETILHAFATSFSTLEQAVIEGNRHSRQDEGALVVVLKSQVLVFSLAGDSHVFPLAFRVAVALPMPTGLILQNMPSLSKSRHDQQHDLQSAGFPTDVTSTAMRASSRGPTTYCITDLLADMGVVASSNSRKIRDVAECPLLPSGERIVYLSAQSEVTLPQIKSPEPIYLAVTYNANASTFTVWQVVYASVVVSKEYGDRSDEKMRRHRSQRQSSNIHERHSMRVPSGRGPLNTSRDSFGGLMQSFVENTARPQESYLSKIEDLAAELGQDFETKGIQTRSARRISSMLARTDFGTSTDRPTYIEPSLNPTSRKSMSRIARQEGSFGSFTERRSFGPGPRTSFAPTASFVSDVASHPGGHLRLSLADYTARYDPGDVIDEPSTHLNRDVVFAKLRAFSSHEETSETTINSARVVVLPSHSSTTSSEIKTRLAVCILETSVQNLSIVTISARFKQPLNDKRVWRAELKSIELQNGQGIDDICVVHDDDVSRLVTVASTTQNLQMIHLEAPGTPSYRLELPSNYLYHHPWAASDQMTNASKRDMGLRRTFPTADIRLSKFSTSKNSKALVVSDAKGTLHGLRLRLRPSNQFICTILNICGLVLPLTARDFGLSAYWEVSKWLESQDITDDSEMVSLAIVLFSMAVPFVSVLQEKPAMQQRRKQGQTMRSSSGSMLDQESWNEMMSHEHTSTVLDPAQCAWSWMPTLEEPTSPLKSPAKHGRSHSIGDARLAHKDIVLLRCANLTREFLQSPAGETMTGPEGCLPTAIGKGRDLRRTALATIVVALQVYHEELKLQSFMSDKAGSIRHILAMLIVQLGTWLGWQDWTVNGTTYFANELPNVLNAAFEPSIIDMIEVPGQPFAPQCIFSYVERSLHASTEPYRTLIDLVLQPTEINIGHPLMSEVNALLPLTALLVSNLKDTAQQAPQSANGSLRDRLIDGINIRLGPATIHNAIHNADLSGVGLLLKAQSEPKGVHAAFKEHRGIGESVLENDGLPRWDSVSELDRQNVTRMLYSEDRRFQEASKLVNQTRPPEVAFIPEAGWTEAEELEAQKLLAQHVTKRTLSVATGRAMMHYSARAPLLTERVPIPSFSMNCIVRYRSESDDQQSVTVNIDKASFTEDKVCWAFFHNGVSAGLMISKDAKGIDTSWILYNKPQDLTNRHAGFLLALGLNGHLKTLAKWVAFKYLTPKHTVTSVGLLLGLAASWIGTGNLLITRVLSVNLTCLLPHGSAELNVSALTQTAALIGIGLVFLNTQHRRMSEVMLSEIESRESEEGPGEDVLLRDEGYRLAAGFSLGLINLGSGRKLHALNDMRVVERLLAIAVGTKNVNMVHVLDRATSGAVMAVAFIFMKTNDRSTARKVDIPDTIHQFDYVRPDIFLLRTLARHLIMWDEIKPTFAFVQQSLPEHYRHRASLKSIKRLTTHDLPLLHVIAGICFAIALRHAGTQSVAARDMLLSFLDDFMSLSKITAMNYDAKVTLSGIRNCLDLLALSAATVMAGSGDIAVMRRLRALHGRVDKDIPFGSHLASHMALGALFLSGGTATFGTSAVAVASLVIAFYPLFPTDVLDNGRHLQALRHLWVFAVESRCLVLRDINDGHIIGSVEAYIALVDGSVRRSTTPCLVPEYDQIKSIRVSAEDYEEEELDLDHLDEGSNISNGASRTVRDTVRISGKGINISMRRRALYDKPNTDVFAAELQAADQGHLVPSADVNAAVNTRWRTNTSQQKNGNPFGSVFQLESFRDLDYAERALVTEETNTASEHVGTAAQVPGFLNGTIVDQRLELDLGTLGPSRFGNEWITGRAAMGTTSRDKLWQVRLLLSWVDSKEARNAGDEDGTLSSSKDDALTEKRDGRQHLRDEFIERLRWRLWQLGSSEERVA